MALASQAVGISPTERLKLRQQVTAAAGQKNVSFPVVNDLEVEVVHLGRALLGGRRVDEQTEKGAAEGVEDADFQGAEMEPGEMEVRSRAKLAILASSGHSSTPCCLRSRWRWTWRWSARRA